MNAAAFVVFNANGRILRTGTCPETMVNGQAGEGESVITATASYAADYVLDEVVVARPPSSVVLDDLTLTGIPVGARISVNEAVYTADGTDVELSFVFPGRYRVKVDAFPMLPFETTVIV